MRVAIVFENFGPYHLARLKAASQVCTLLAAQIHARSSRYAWEPCLEQKDFQCFTAAQNDQIVPQHIGQLLRRVRSALTEFRPDCVFIPGWSERYSRACLSWCRGRGIPVIMMSETTKHDSRRRPWKEWLKRRILAKCSAALVGGSLHSDYVASLGMARS